MGGVMGEFGKPFACNELWFFGFFGNSKVVLLRLVLICLFGNV